jgi:hypothetical protein
MLEQLESSSWNFVFDTTKVKQEEFIGILEANKLPIDKLPTFDHDLLKSIGITDVNDRLVILNCKNNGKSASKIPFLEILAEFDGKNKIVKVQNSKKENVENAVCQAFSVNKTDYELHLWNEK